MTAQAGSVLVTGASGFVGRALCRQLEQAGWLLRTPGRSDLGEIDADTDWRPWIEGADAVIHLAARVHVMRETAADADEHYDRTNRAATVRLAEQAAKAGVRRFVFLSSVKVHGDHAVRPLTAADTPRPSDPYGRSKHAAERALREVPGLDAVILRPPLVYGPGVRGNFLALMRLVDRGWPLPLASIDNRRSLIYLGNLVDAIETALAAPPGTYLPSDRQDVSTPALVRAVARAMGCPARLFPTPVAALGAAAAVLGRRDAIDRLRETLAVDGELPGWQPRFSLEEGMAKTADWYRQAGS